AAREAPRDPRRHAHRLLGLRARVRSPQGGRRGLSVEERRARRDPRHGRAGCRGRADALGRDCGARAARVRARARGGALPRAARRAHRARGGDPEAPRHRRVEPRDRPAALHQRADGQEPRRQHLPEAPGERPHQGGTARGEARPRREAAMRGTALRAPLIVAGAAVTVWSVLQFRLADWPIYVVYALLSVVLFRFYVEVLPDMHLPVPGLALTIGFLYVGGPPIIVLRLAEPVLASGLRALVPARWRDRLVGASVGGAGAVASLFWIREWSGRAAAAEWASFALGLAVRWWVVSRLVPGGDVTGHPAAIAIAELAGYLAWAPMATLPIYSYRPFLPPAPAFRGLETVIQD